MHNTLHDSRRATQCVCMRASFIPSSCHPWCRPFLVTSSFCPSPISLRWLSLLFHTLPALWPALHLQCQRRRGNYLLRLRTTRSIVPCRYTILPQIMSPTSLTTSTTQETSAMILQDESDNKDTEPSNFCGAELDDETIGKALSSPLFIQEREEPVDRSHSHEESLLPTQSFFAHTRTERPVHELSSCQKRKSSREMETKESRFSLKDKKNKISLKLIPRFRNTNFKSILIEEVSRNWMKLSSFSEQRLIILYSDEQLRWDQLLLHEQLSEQNRDLREAHIKVCMRWKNWSEFKSYELTNLREEDRSKIRTLLKNSRQEFRNYRMKSIVWMIRDFKYAESVRSGLSHVASQLALLLTFSRSWRDAES